MIVTGFTDGIGFSPAISTWTVPKYHQTTSSSAVEAKIWRKLLRSVMPPVRGG